MIEIVMANGRGVLTRDGLTEADIQGADDTAVRAQLIHLVRSEAAQLGSPLVVRAISASGTQDLLVHPNGQIEQAPAASSAPAAAPYPVEAVAPAQPPVQAPPEPAPVVAVAPPVTPVFPDPALLVVPAWETPAAAAPSPVYVAPDRPAPAPMAPATGQGPWGALNGDYGVITQRPAPAAEPVRASGGYLDDLLGEVPGKGEPMASPAAQLDRPLRILVASNKGGQGKTPTAVLLAAAFGQMRGGDVAVLDLNPTGNLANRMSVPATAPTLLHLVDQVKALGAAPSWANLTRMFAWDESARAWMVGSRRGLLHEGRQVESHISGEDLERVMVAVETGFRVVILDGGNNHGDDAFLAAVGMADQLVVPTKLDIDGVRAAGQMLDDLGALGWVDLVGRALIVESQPPLQIMTRAMRQQQERFRDGFRRRGHQLVTIPPDAQINKKTAIRWETLKPKTRDAATGLARAILERHLAGR